MLVVSLGTMVVCEVIFRVLLFSGADFMQRFRNPDLYGAWDSDDDYWKLYYLFGGRFKPPEHPHPRLGWIGTFSPETYLHNNAGEVGDKIPILLYGDSFAECSTIANKNECFQGIVNNDSELGRRFFLLNYGVGGYGVDQMYLLLKESLPLYRNPFVIVGIMTQDLDRSALAVRIGQKPFFSVEDGALALKGVPVSPHPAVFFAENPPRIVSYLARMWANRDGRFYRIRQLILGTEDQVRIKKMVNEKIILAMVAELNRRNIPHLFLIFYPDWIYNDPADWREMFLRNLFEEHHIPYLSTKEIIQEDARKSGKQPIEYYDDSHPTADAYRLLAGVLKAHILNSSVNGGQFLRL
ncbi:hypothetical protein DNFV4_02990 [Nitrospira tepida]|uniref:SGNH hydrolase-type esterase domain-containing protein n=1 Tax=Nitrospira tepida TaxID=2973512 RepID=A0AA86N0L9_9BACT|nr:hypothetical protein [Nitrospira tepida]CAI4032560.1 hypothetical protein DNFV4_02990 [Nitrospira tepida]